MRVPETFLCRLFPGGCELPTHFNPRQLHAPRPDPVGVVLPREQGVGARQRLQEHPVPVDRPGEARVDFHKNLHRLGSQKRQVRVLAPLAVHFEHEQWTRGRERHGGLVKRDKRRGPWKVHRQVKGVDFAPAGTSRVPPPQTRSRCCSPRCRSSTALLRAGPRDTQSFPRLLRSQGGLGGNTPRGLDASGL